MKSTGKSTSSARAKKTASKTAPRKTASAKKAPAAKSGTGKSPVKKAAKKTPKASPKVATSAAAKAARKPGKSKKAASAASDSRRFDLLRMVEKSLDADKGEDIVHVDLADKSPIADFMVIATGRNSRQLAAMAQHVAEKLSKAGVRAINIEGLSQGDWVLVDAGDIIVHLFRPEIRTLYGLEKMWGVNPPEPEALQAVG